MHVSQAWNHLFRPGLRKDFRDEYRGFEVEWSGIVRSGTMDRAEIEAVTLSGLPRQVELGELEAYPSVDAKLSDLKRYTDREFGLKFGISQKTVENDQYGKANKSAKWLGRSTRLAQEYDVADMLDDAFTGTNFTGVANEAMISATHSSLNTQETRSNLIPGNPQLSNASLSALLELGENGNDHQGDPIPVRYEKLVINISDENMAILLTQNEMEPNSADRNMNVNRRRRRFSYVVSHYKDQSGKDWFGVDPSLNDAHLDFFVKPQFDDWFDKDVRAAYYASRQRFATYFYDWLGWAGSNAT